MIVSRQINIDCLRNPQRCQPDLRIPTFSAPVLILRKHAKLALSLAGHWTVPRNFAGFTHGSHRLLFRLLLGAGWRTEANDNGSEQETGLAAHGVNIKQAPRHASLRSLWKEISGISSRLVSRESRGHPAGGARRWRDCRGRSRRSFGWARSTMGGRGRRCGRRAQPKASFAA